MRSVSPKKLLMFGCPVLLRPSHVPPIGTHTSADRLPSVSADGRAFAEGAVRSGRAGGGVRAE